MGVILFVVVVVIVIVAVILNSWQIIAALAVAAPFLWVLWYVASGREKRRQERISQEVQALARARGAAANPRTSAVEFRRLATSNDAQVIAALLANPSIPPDLHSALIIKQSSMAPRRGFGYGVIFGPGNE